MCLDKEALMKLQQGHGGWNPRMTEYLMKVGTVHRITDKGDIRLVRNCFKICVSMQRLITFFSYCLRVQYEGCANRWTFHPAALVKVCTFHVGDLVTIINDAAKVQVNVNEVYVHRKSKSISFVTATTKRPR